MVRIPLSLRGKLTVAFLLVLLPVLGLVIYSHLQEYRRAQESVLRDQLRTAEAVGATVEAVLNQGVSVCKTLAIDPVIRDFPRLSQEELQSYLARYLPLFPEYRDINVWGADGLLVAASGGYEPGKPLPNISDLQHFQQAMSTGSPAVSSVIIFHVVGESVVAIAAPITDDAGHPSGAVTIVLNIGQMARNLQGMYLSDDHVVYVTDGNGWLIFHSAKPNLEWGERDVSWHQSVEVALAQKRFVGIVEGVYTEGLHMVAGAKTRNYGWVSAISVAEETVLGPVQRSALTSLTVYLAIVLLSGALALGVTYTITRPLGHLTHAMTAFGIGDLQRRARFRTGDELEVAADSFNRMADALQREQGRLQSLVEMGTELATAIDVRRIAEILAERSSALLGEASCVCVLFKEQQECQEMALHTPDSQTRDHLLELFRHYDQWATLNLYRPVLETGEPVLIPDIGSSWLKAGLRRDLVEAGAQSLLVVPLLGHRRIVGVLVNLSISAERRLGESELALATDLASRAGLVVDNALLFQRIQEEQLRLQTILDTAPVGIVVAEGPAGRIGMANRAAIEMLGGQKEQNIHFRQWSQRYSICQLNGQPYPAERIPLIRSLLDRQVVKGEEMVIVKPSGDKLYILAYSSPLPTQDRESPAAVLAFLDITPLKQVQRRAEESARQAERQRKELDAVIGGVAEGVTIVDGTGRIQRINERGKEIWGIPDIVEEADTVYEYRGKLALCYPDGRPMPFEQWPLNRALRGDVFSCLEAVYDRADGRKTHLLFSSGAVRDEKGEVHLAVTVYGDITPIRELERAREEFISVIAHDLRSPLTVITGFGGILRRLTPEQHGQLQERKAVESILSSAKRLERMVADLLDASRIEASRLVLTKEEVDLPELIECVVERSVEITRGHTVATRIGGDIPPLQADPTRLEQILTNLLSNASKYSYPDTEILVEVKRSGRDIQVSVTNQGAGISPEDIEQLFSRFRRTRAAVETKAPGLGLGLYITKGLIEAHGGLIWVESEVGKYATFHFTLPLDSE